MDIGGKIKGQRLQRKMTLRDLGKRTGVTPGFLSQVERNLASPSTPTLIKIALSLRVNITYFLEDFSGKEEKRIVVKRNKRKRFECGKSMGNFDLLITNPQTKRVFPIIRTLKIGEKCTQCLHCCSEEKFGLILQGKIEMVAKKEKYILGEGDSFYFESYKSFCCKNIGDSEAKIFLASTLPK